MPVIKTTITGPQFLEEGALPINFHIDEIKLSLGGIPAFPVEIDAGAFDFGIIVDFICPGYPLCGVSKACATKFKKVFEIDLTALIPITFPGIPDIPILPSIGPFDITFPPKGYLPLTCPNYNKNKKTT
jgi:hypothetical protein